MPLQPRSRRGAAGVTKINAADDPFQALDLAVEYLTSVLRQRSRRNAAAAWGWCWTAVHIVDAVAAAVERRELPRPWFRDRASWRLAPRGWAPLDPVADTFRLILARQPQQQEDPR